MTTMIERVARAIWDSDAADDEVRAADPWESAVDDVKYVYRKNARAAIEVMREPDVEMIAAFWRQKNCGTQEVGQVGDARSDYDAWRAAIDAAILEQQP